MYTQKGAAQQDARAQRSVWRCVTDAWQSSFNTGGEFSRERVFSFCTDISFFTEFPHMRKICSIFHQGEKIGSRCQTGLGLNRLAGQVRDGPEQGWQGREVWVGTFVFLH